MVVGHHSGDLLVSRGNAGGRDCEFVLSFQRGAEIAPAGFAGDCTPSTRLSQQRNNTAWPRSKHPRQARRRGREKSVVETWGGASCTFTSHGYISLQWLGSVGWFQSRDAGHPFPFSSRMTDKMIDSGRSDTKKKCRSAYGYDRSCFSSVATSTGHGIVTIEIYSGLRFMRTRLVGGKRPFRFGS